MRKFTTIILLFFAVTLSAQNVSFKKFYKAHKSQAEVSFNIPGFIGRMFIDKKDVDVEYEKLIKEARNFKILVFDKNPDVVAKDFKKFVRTNKLKTLVKVKDGKDKAEIYFIERNNYIREIIISAGNTEEELVLLGLKTKLTKDELASIVSEAKNDVASK